MVDLVKIASSLPEDFTLRIEINGQEVSFMAKCGTEAMRKCVSINDAAAFPKFELAIEEVIKALKMRINDVRE